MKKLLFVIALVTALTVTATAQMNMGGMSNKGMNALAKLSGKSYDIAWMSQMIEHHKGALTMAQMCVKACKVPKVKAAAQGIIADQTKEINQMTGWLKSWYNAKPDTKQQALMRADMKPMMDNAMGNMAPMGDMPMPADKSFLEGMIPHHESAVMMGKDALKKASKPELKKFAQSVIDAQTREINQYKTWLKTL